MAYNRRPALLLCTLLLLLPAASEAGETRRYSVRLQGSEVGHAVLTYRRDSGGTTTYTHHSKLTSSRDGKTSERVLHEEVRVKDGVLLSAWAVRISGGQRQAVSARWDARAGAMVVRRGDRVERVPVDSAAGVEALFEAPRRLIESGSVGARRRVFDLPDGNLGWVILRQARDERGWAETEELGVRVRSRWAPGAALPDALDLVDIGLVYAAEGIEAGNDVGRMADLTGGSVVVEGTLVPGVRLRLSPPEDWPGLACADREVTLPAAGPLCGAGTDEAPTRRLQPSAGPQVRGLVARVKGQSITERAASLAQLIDGQLDPEVDGAGLWEAEPETALARGRGDCNEAAAVFLASAPLLGLDARRRTGLFQDPAEPTRLWPHTWVEVRTEKGWIRVDPSRGQAPAEGVYLDLGAGDSLAGQLRSVAPALRGAQVKVVGAPPPGTR
ncbi:MAG: transglutaminase domain-containing protein [Deltaproteobacteria bacterium]|nr:transglutaminase domain-containing protein [Deltaproteobacteria bacterium]